MSVNNSREPSVEDTLEEQFRTVTRSTEQHRARDTERDPERAVPEPEHGTRVTEPSSDIQLPSRD
jgi:hypothetical protein